MSSRSLPAINLVYSRDDFSDISVPERVNGYPELRYMGSKRRLLPWIHGVLRSLDFDTALDPFVGSGCVAYLLKAMGKRVMASDFLNFPCVLAKATIENSRYLLDGPALRHLLAPAPGAPEFIAQTFKDVFFSENDLRFLDRVCANVETLAQPELQAMARSALIRSCLKKQPRGVFTVSGDLSRYNDGRRDLRLSIEEHFLEQVEVFNQVVFDNGRRHTIRHADAFEVPIRGVDLVYLDPPYVPRSDDNCYIKRYHFLEGLSCYWQGLPVRQDTKVRKIEKRFTPFSYRRTALDAFDRMFHRFRNSIIVLSYSSNGYPDREHLEQAMRRYKRHVVTYEKAHRYHFGTHQGVERAQVREYLLVGR